ncbi:hypothetical protein CYMTET_43469 [Cymbomonas tetramitiformis]|uniref:BTB domain-containing protein n=1 Tax=Cymbomonas tetramitiformis TaxID=36881 RepID=A0AAE0C247_9CHLO|nr:hypothetical protein CYMTET_43469 [Cymbomonas tetramitiformis]
MRDADCEPFKHAHHDDVRFHIVSALLTNWSPVMRAMMSHDCKETATNEILWSDVTPRAAESFLRFLYTGKICIVATNVLEIEYLADKYDRDMGVLSSLVVSRCVEYIEANASQSLPWVVRNLHITDVKFILDQPHLCAADSQVAAVLVSWADDILTDDAGKNADAANVASPELEWNPQYASGSTDSAGCILATLHDLLSSHVVWQAISEEQYRALLRLPTSRNVKDVINAIWQEQHPRGLEASVRHSRNVCNTLWAEASLGFRASSSQVGGRAAAMPNTGNTASGTSASLADASVLAQTMPFLGYWVNVIPSRADLFPTKAALETFARLGQTQADFVAGPSFGFTKVITCGWTPE